MLSVIELHLGLVYFSAFFVITVVVSVCSFEGYSRVVFFNSFRALTSLSAGQVVFGFSYFDLDMLCLNKFQVVLKGKQSVEPGASSLIKHKKKMWFSVLPVKNT